MSREKKIYGLCETPGCYRVMQLTRYKGKYVCGMCVNPYDEKRHAVEFLKQRIDAYTPENTPAPGLSYNDIIVIQRKIGVCGRKPLPEKRE